MEAKQGAGATAVVDDRAIFQSNMPLAEKLERARVELLDLSARNRLLNMPRGARGGRSIEMVDEKAEEIFRLLVREGKTFTFVAGRAAKNEELAPPSAAVGERAAAYVLSERTEGTSPAVEPDEIEDLAQPDDDSTDERGVLRRHADTKLQTRLTSKGLQKCLLELYLDANTLEEEQGVNVLFLAIGALKWMDPSNAENVRYAPLLLIPVQLDRGNAGERFKLKVRQEDFASNLSLDAYLDRVHALRMPAFEATDTFDPLDYIQQVRKSVEVKTDWEVLPNHMTVGFFSFAKFLMYRDLDPAVWPKGSTISDHPLIRSLLADGFAGSDDLVDEDANIDPLIPPVEMLHILDCDSSQALAIHEVRRGKNLVIQGPPGTGKSQTIANIIAAAVKDGKSVLFVAEKMAALDVVKRRLDDRGVGDACLELHSNKTSKRAVLEELRRTWELGAPRAPSHGSLFDRLTEARDKLNAHVHRLHERDSASGATPFQVMGQLIRLREQGERPNDIRLDAPEQWGQDGFSARLDLLSDLASRVAEIGKPADHAWVGVGLDAISPMDAERLVGRVQKLSDQLAAARQQFNAAATMLELDPPLRLSDVPPMVELLQRIAPAPMLSADAMGSEIWKNPSPIKELLNLGERYAAENVSLLGRVTDAAWDANLEEPLCALGELPEAFNANQFKRLGRMLDELPLLMVEAAALARLLGREPGGTLGDYQTLARIGERVAAAPPASPETFASDLWDGGVERAGELAQALGDFEAAKTSIGSQLTEMAWSLDLASARSVLAARGTSFLRFFSGEWRAANRLVGSVLVTPNQPLPIKLGLLDTLAKGQAAKKAIEGEDTFGRSAFGDDWRGVRSYSAPLLALVEWMRSLKGLGAEPRLIASRSPEKTEVAARAKQLSGACLQIERDLRTTWEDLGRARGWAFGDVASVERADLQALVQVAARYTEAHTAANGWITSGFQEAGAIHALLEELQAGQRDRQTLRDQVALGQTAFDDAWQAERSDWSILKAAAGWLEQNQDIGALAGRVRERDALLPRAKVLTASQAHIQASFKALADDLQLDVEVSMGGTLPDVLLETMTWRLQRWSQEHERLFRWVNYRDRSAKATTMGCSELVIRLGDGRLTPDTVTSAFEMAYFEATYARMVQGQPALARFDGATHGRLVQEFADLDRQRIAAASVQVVRAHYESVPPRDGSALGPLGVLRGEIQKRRGHIAVRKLVERAAPALRALKPVFMMSPLSVAQFLVPGAMEFDLLVMDEASQIQPVDALGAIARAKQVVVVGDPKQLPPTAFFAKMTSSSEDDEDEDGAVVADIESILGLFMARGLPTRMLRWHYRSRHQSLIAVSNRQFYDNKLFIVPSPYTAQGGRGLRFHHIHEGLFDAGNKRNNLIEAKAVARAIIAHAQTYPKLSLGVAAFSAAQRRVIIDELEVLRRGLPAEVEDFFRAHRSEPFFVKNLENVQGDERDVIFISVGYGRSVPHGRVPMRFGPLGTEGGERRLNVLISRAKQRCDVFASMTDEDIDPSYAAGKKGVYAFRLFLQYARTGHLQMAEVTGRDHDSVFEEQVANALRARGYDIQAQIGLAGFFIDLAVLDEGRPGRFLLGIECDGAAYHSSRSARDRDRLRQAVLEEHGWTIHRIWSTDWFQRPSEQLEQLVRRIETIKAEYDEHQQEVALTEQLDADAPYVERETVEDGGDEVSFAPYQEATLVRPRHVIVDLHEAPQGILTQLVEEAVRIEGPVHRDQVITRIREAWGLKRAGGRIEEAVERSIEVAAKMQRIARHGDFLSLPGREAVPRDRSEITATALRKAEMLPPAEIEVAVSQLVQRSFGATRDQVIQAVSRGLGIRNTSSQVRGALENVIEKMIARRQLKEAAGLLTVE
jgi:very-short-patch-repair endonuclease